MNLNRWNEIFKFTPHVPDTSQWVEGNSWYSPHLALTRAAGCRLWQRKKMVYIFISWIMKLCCCPCPTVLGGLWMCFSLEATFWTHLYPWHGWTARGCRPQRWAWLESLHHREVGCGSGSPLRLFLCLRRFLWPLQGKQLSLGKSVLHWEDCRLLWVWWWSAAALEGHFVGFPPPKYPAITW